MDQKILNEHLQKEYIVLKWVNGLPLTKEEYQIWMQLSAQLPVLSVANQQDFVNLLDAYLNIHTQLHNQIKAQGGRQASA